MPIQLARLLLLVVAIAVVTALLDSLLYWATGGSFTMLLWATWQLATLMVLVVNVPPIFDEVHSAFVRRAAAISLVIALHAIASYLGIWLFGNVRELFGVPI